MQEQSEMFDMAEDFFVSLGMKPMVKDFCENSVFKDNGKKMVCHASAWDFLDTVKLADSRYRFVVIYS